MDEKLQARAEQLAQEFAGSATTIGELNQLMRLMMKSGLERMLDTEMDVHLGRKGSPAEKEPPATARKPGPPNRRNGRSKKTVQGELGEAEEELVELLRREPGFGPAQVRLDALRRQQR